jgi:hypothetical protein
LRWRTPLQATGYVRASDLVVMVIKNQVFSSTYMLLSLVSIGYPDFHYRIQLKGTF